jgi:hypothetical protein
MKAKGKKKVRRRLDLGGKAGERVVAALRKQDVRPSEGILRAVLPLIDEARKRAEDDASSVFVQRARVADEVKARRKVAPGSFVVRTADIFLSLAGWCGLRYEQASAVRVALAIRRECFQAGRRAYLLAEIAEASRLLDLTPRDNVGDQGALAEILRELSEELAWSATKAVDLARARSRAEQEMRSGADGTTVGLPLPDYRKLEQIVGSLR